MSSWKNRWPSTPRPESGCSDSPPRPTKRRIKVGVGLMCRHCRSRGTVQEGPGWRHRPDHHHARLPHARSRRFRLLPTHAGFEDSELLWQIKRFHSFLWASGGCFSDFYIHKHRRMLLDQGKRLARRGGERRAQLPRRYNIDQNFDNYSVEYTFDDGSKFFLFGRTMAGCHDEFASYAHGQNGLAVISLSGSLAVQRPHLQDPEDGQFRHRLADAQRKAR